MITSSNVLSVQQAIDLIRAEFRGNIVGNIYNTEVGRVMVEATKHYDKLAPCDVYVWGEEPTTDYVVVNRRAKDIDYYVRIGISKLMPDGVIDAMLIGAFAEMACIKITGESGIFSTDDRDVAIQAWYGRPLDADDVSDDVVKYLMAISNKGSFKLAENHWQNAIVRRLVRRWARDSFAQFDEIMYRDKNRTHKKLHELDYYWSYIFEFCRERSIFFTGEKVDDKRIDLYRKVTENKAMTTFEFVRGLLCDEIKEKKDPETGEKKTGGKGGRSAKGSKASTTKPGTEE